MSDIDAFVSDDPRVLAAFEQGLTEWDAWRQRIEEAKKEVGGRNFFRRRRAKGWEMVGIEDRENERIPDGWVKLKRKQFLTPNLRNKEGKQKQAWLDSLAGPDMLGLLAPFGLPRDSMVMAKSWFDGYIYKPSVAKYEGRVFVTWNSIVTWEGSGYFKPVPLSEYYAAKEATESVAAS
jgi:hypothetical protein